ncbi:hypothetical protein [Amycolatopsis sp. FDAARGOS 1241]|uniref:DUF7144 family membrane protein n=1 Tax=Amycolatopsis sp. FDAARGOS 1241 TaxID=2778070 RepID=UPI00194DCB8B|nr:hypothetical protein [Amycolatopsis sp. FDAARGOS 1241]QRP48558.1 hypothetical protein I6J71_12355 [Amycolatopsis sp. FDAARGOS 1241]
MTDTGARATHTEAGGTTGRRPDTTPTATGWTGWVAFAAIMMLLLGAFQIIEGLVALLNTRYFVVDESGLVIQVNYTTWGWVHLALGALLVLVGIGVYMGNRAAQITGIVLAGLSAIVNLAFLPAYPLWAIIVIAVDVLVIYALAVHGKEIRAL